MLLDLLHQVQVGIGEVDQEDFLATLAQQLEGVRFAIYQRLSKLSLDKRPPKSDLLTIPQLAARLQVRPATLYRRVSRGQLDATRVGKLIRVTEADAIKPRGRRPKVERLA